MKKIIYSIINDETFGIKVKDDMKLNILRILDKIETKVSILLNSPIMINKGKIEKFGLSFVTYDKDELVGSFELTELSKILRISKLPTLNNPNMIEDYMIIEHSNGLVEYKTRYEYKNSKNYSKNEYCYQGKTISEEEASNLLNPKTK